MKILHTADVHIREYNDERWQALKQVVHVGRENDIDVLVIAGDLFDSDAAAHKLRPKVREIFSDLTFPVLIISGNHDADAYPNGAFLGEGVTVIEDLLQPFIHNGYHFWGFPYRDLQEEEILEYLHMAGQKTRQIEGKHLLLFHGELLDIIDGWVHYGDEGNQRYLPVKLSYFRNLPFQYVLAGHFHSTFDVHEFKEDAYFVYCGSPIAITRRESGPRKANLFTFGNIPEPVELSTPYFEKLRIHLDISHQSNPLAAIKTRLEGLPENAKLLIDIDGFFNGAKLEMTEQELQRALQKVSGKQVEITRMEFHDIRDVVEDELFREFYRKLKARQLDEEDERAVLNMTLKAMMELTS
ncbi:MAG: metallophosphoesterase family protein [Calditrichia bacterium]